MEGNISRTFLLVFRFSLCTVRILDRTDLMKALVIGGAKSGYGASLLLQKLGYEVVLVSRDDFKGSEELEKLGIKVILDDTETDAYDAYDLVVKNPGIPNNHQLVKRFDTVYNEIEIAFN